MRQTADNTGWGIVMRRKVQVWGIVLVAVLTVFLSGCGQKKTEPEKPAAVSDGLGPAESLDARDSQQESFVEEGRTSGPMLPVYFAFDSAAIRGEQVARLEKNAAFLKEQSGLIIRLEGNCDPRGTREYNLALGERRAQSVKKYLVNLGIAPQRLKTISWGEEKLLLFGQDELSWAQNRRVDFVIIGGKEN